MTRLLVELADARARGTAHVVDLTQPPGPATPVIGLPPVFAASPGVNPADFLNVAADGSHSPGFDALVPA